MATDKHPNQNVNMPMSANALAAARARLGTSGAGSPPLEPRDGKGSRREVRPGEWINDRKIILNDLKGSRASDSPPEWDKKDERAVPASFDPLKAYSVTLAKGVVFCGRMLSPGKIYQMQGEACTEIVTASPGSILDAVEIGDVPVDPDAQPS